MKIPNIHPTIYAKTLESNDIKSYGVSVFTHMLIVGLVCKEYIKHIPTQFVDKYKLESFPLFAALHDLGKASPGFQEMLKYFMGSSSYDTIDDISDIYEIRHENVSAEHIMSHNKFDNRIINEAECIAELIRYHHGTRRSTLDILDNKHKFGDDTWITIRNDIYNACVDVFGSGDDFIDVFSNSGKNILNVDVKYVSGLLGICDWIGSNENFFPPHEFMGNELDVDLITSYAHKAIIENGLGIDEVHSDLNFTNIFKFEPNAMQRQFASVVDSKGLYILEAPMGEGKTEAALHAAYNCLDRKIVRGVYFGLPTQTTSNTMFERYKNFIGKITDYDQKNVRLLHGNHAVMNNPSDSWFQGNRTGILSSYGLGTADQSLLSVLGNVKHFFIRTFGLANKCVILDEVHSYDMYTSSLMKEMIDQLIELDCVVIILSATLTSGGRGKLTEYVDNVAQYPLITKVTDDSISYHGIRIKPKTKSIKLTHVKVKSGDVGFIQSRESLIQSSIERAMNGEMILWIENTVHDAQTLYKRIESELGDQCGLLHSRFTTVDREHNENLWVTKFGKGGDRSKGCILVSTQVCEQSIDIDADLLITALCPSDMMFQRLGRDQRHEQDKIRCSPECIILSHEAFDTFNSTATGNNLAFQFRQEVQSGAYVYDLYILYRTYNIWKNLNNVSIPDDIRNILELTYNDETTNNIEKEFKFILDRNLKEQINDSNNSLSSTGGIINDDNTATIIDDELPVLHGTRRILQQTIDVILVSEVLSENSFMLRSGDTIKLETKMTSESRALINKNTVKLADRFTSASIIGSCEIGNNTYYYANITPDGLILNNNMGISNHQYTTQIGFM